MRINREIRAPKVRVIDAEGKQVGVLATRDALLLAEKAGLDLVEFVPNAVPPVCKIINFGKFRYDQTKREKEGKKAQVAGRVKEVKFRPNIGDHDFDVKVSKIRDFLGKGFKVKITCTFRGREMAHVKVGEEVLNRLCQAIEGIGQVETPNKQMGRFLTLVLAPGSEVGKKKVDTQAT